MDNPDKKRRQGNAGPLIKTDKTPEEWAQWRAEVAVEAAQAAEGADHSETVSAYADTPEIAAKDSRPWREHTKAEMETVWEDLRRHAIAAFPEGRAHRNLSGPQKLVAIAHCLGWTQAKIAAASGIHEDTVARWLRRPDLQIFINEFQIRTGETDPQKLLDEGSYLGLKFGISLMKDPVADARLKLDAAKWLVERRHGKPNQPIEHRANLADVFKQIHATTATALLPAEEEKLFSDLDGPEGEVPN